MATNTTETKLISPSCIGHFGLRTTPENFEAMVQWHLNFFGGHITLRNEKAAFIAYDEEHHRLVIVNDKSHRPIDDRRTATGIYHIAFTLRSLSELVESYEQRKALGILPHWPVNHGMSTSMYYFDPDGNEFELQVDNFDTPKAAREFMASEEYAQNPIGVDIDMDEFIARVRSGEDEAAIKKRPVIGPRLSRWENSIYFKE
ncbi:Glyoxalase/Bleomycin resistance protein/Dihydroxybiphenyl dioxygenase [Penicillium paradoxum]|uniref:Glyoxalase/Bleomycin resistance protein/Dihydroxybiphenyl dioxygenase n=1 Tax=Penicillium paradoxum TaxID=176176 RepID=UPI0025469E2C|nr:Glyoxalase/Bleomycin resistance protein/Dihydroxybiphenyl dioxygenase [Penicillium paradoxum]KAJ5779252.1 Glyoxalase/Bleomycin resistance protein/Dihydroxybiphenyl dioxygenase [Penicillium paradoxum]